MPTFTSLAEASAAIQRDMKARERRLQTAIRKTARQTRNYVVRNVPRAFGELADNVHADDVSPGHSDVIADAPHAAAVEVGSRPHVVPIEDLIAWVQLRGLQGLTRAGNVARSSSRRLAPARIIAQQLRGKLGQSGAKAWRARMVLGSLSQRESGADPATLQVARAIQRAIATRGTKPHRYMFDSVPASLQFLDTFVKEALPDQ